MQRQAIEVSRKHSFFANFFPSLSQNEISSYFSVANLFATNIIPSKHAGSIRYDVKWREKKLCLWCDGWHIRINWIISILKHKRNRKSDFFHVRSILFSPLKHQKHYFHKKNCFWCSFGEIKVDLTLKVKYPQFPVREYFLEGFTGKHLSYLPLKK